MSRCFPFRAPICKKGGPSAIGSIENGLGSSKQNKEQGLNLKEKPTKKRNRDENEKLNSLHDDSLKEKPAKKRNRGEHDKLDSVQHESKRRRDDKQKSKSTEICHNERKYESEHLERSDLTVEHNPPSFLLNQCSSLQRGTKRSQKNEIQNSDPNKNKPEGMVLRLKLLSNKPEDQKPAPSNTGPCTTTKPLGTSRTQTALTDPPHRPKKTSLLDRAPVPSSIGPCSTSQVSDTSRTQTSFAGSSHRPKNKPLLDRALSIDPCSTSQPLSTSRIQTASIDSARRPNETSLLKQPPFSKSDGPSFSGRVTEEPARLPDSIAKAHSKSRHSSRSHRHSKSKSERRFKEFILNWNPPPGQFSETEEKGELDWLLVSRQQSKDENPSAQISVATISKPSTCSAASNSLQPRACYLPECGMYQLPYVIPF